MDTQNKPAQMWRFLGLTGFQVAIAVLIFGWTISFQFSTESEQLLTEGERLYQGFWLEVVPPRGPIYDTTGHLLAGNQIVYEVGLELKFVKTPDTIAKVLNALLGLDYAEVVAIASIPYSADSVYAMVRRGVPAEKALALQEAIDRWADTATDDEEESLAGVVIFPYLARTYPEKDLASSVLGFVALDGSGYYGLEQRYDSVLTGLSQKIWVPNNPNYATEMPEIPPGSTLILTLDREIQAMVEEQLDMAVQRYDAKSATAIVINPKTGEILAMASNPRLDINEYWRYSEVYTGNTPFNRAISETYEPGSVFKIFTMAGAIEAEIVEPNTVFFDPGYFEYGQIIVRNWDRMAYGEQDMIGCLQHSLNVCLAWIGSEMSADLFYKYMDAFGFGHYTGIDLANEATGRLKEPGDGDWYPADLATNTFGQGVSVTPIQLVTAASAFANGGQMVVPHVIQSIVDNQSQYDIHTQIAGTPISAETAQTITDMLAISLEEEASEALVDGYRIAGKTGTAEIPGEQGYSSEISNASFIGWGPVDDPQFLVFVWLEEPTPIWGSKTAAPTFAEIVNRLVVLLQLPPDSVRDKLGSN